MKSFTLKNLHKAFKDGKLVPYNHRLKRSILFHDQDLESGSEETELHPYDDKVSSRGRRSIPNDIEDSLLSLNRFHEEFLIIYERIDQGQFFLYS